VKTVPGWYGKLPSVGDFASRRWPDVLISPWDGWLAEEIDALRRSNPDGWLQGYLDSPTWRFVLGAGVLGSQQTQPLAGVLMPSVDRVGRYFPLGLAAELDRLPKDAQETDALLNWLHTLDDLAADVLQQDWTIDELERHLPDHPAPRWTSASTSLSAPLQSLFTGEARLIALPLTDSRQAMIAGLGQGLLDWAMACFTPDPSQPLLANGLSWWWSEPDSQPDQRQVLLGKGLPRGADFTRLLGQPACQSDLGVASHGVSTAEMTR
jgi:type VI secretion system protein ImpM